MAAVAGRIETSRHIWMLYEKDWILRKKVVELLTSEERPTYETVSYYAVNALRCAPVCVIC